MSKVAQMPQKNRKGKKKENVKKRKQKDEVENKREKGKNGGRGLETLSLYFTTEELQQLKNVSKNKDLSNITVIIATVILNKLELLTKLVRNGYNIHETGPNHTTALMWAVKFKNMSIIEFLLANGANVTVKNENGDNALILALENKIWDEESFIWFWNSVTNIEFIDVDFVNKNGRNMLHAAIRRDWGKVVEILIAAKVNVNCENFYGVTPLMLASYHYNINFVNVLLEANADVLKEDINGNTALCYAISHVITKNIPPPHFVVDKLIINLCSRNITFKDFLKNKIEQLLNDSGIEKETKRTLADSNVPSIISYTLSYVQKPLEIMLDLNILEQLAHAILKCISQPSTITKLLTIINEVLKYCEDNFDTDAVKSLLLQSFENEEVADACLLILKTYSAEKFSEYNFISQAFEPIMTLCTFKIKGSEWLSNNYHQLIPYYERYLILNLIQQSNDTQTKRLKNFETLMGTVISDNKSNDSLSDMPNTSNAYKVEEDEQFEQKTIQKESKLNAKKSKRRSRALKAKMAKIKSADLTERLNQNDKKVSKQKSDGNLVENEQNRKIEKRTKKWMHYSAWEQIWLMDDKKQPNVDDFSKVVSVLENNIPLNLRDEMFNVDIEPKFKYNIRKDKTNDLKGNIENSSSSLSSTEDETDDVISFFLCYLSGLLKRVIKTYKRVWIQDRRQNEEEIFASEYGNVYNEYENTTSDEAQEHLDSLHEAFHCLMRSIESKANKNLPVCMKVIDSLENMLLTYKVRGNSFLSDLYMQNKSDLDLSSLKCLENLLNIDNSLEDFDIININNEQNDLLSQQRDLDSFYLQELSMLSPRKSMSRDKARLSKMKTMRNAYHLIPSIITMCNDSDDDDIILDKQEETERRNNPNSTIQKKRNTLHETLSAMPNVNETQKFLAISEKTQQNYEFHSPFENIPSRWTNMIQSLQVMINHKVLLKGQIRISVKENDEESHIISQGGNFSSVIMGLDSHNCPLAIKRIRKDNVVCEIMKNLLDPLLGLRNANLLHYYTCNYEENELILATPLCEYNMGEYVMIMKQSANLCNRAMDVVKQFLTGLKFLHNRPQAIVHGNLKPSNIFIDLNGTVRIAEFGMYKALYVLTQAPNTSIIWFSRETFTKFNKSNIMECTCASDIQVAAMLVHFVLTAGKHPYGDTMQDILKNLERALPQLTTNNVDLHDLISWMLLYEPLERPMINQVLSHVFFWTIDRKWRFILACSGISPHGTSLNIPLDELHLYINMKATKEKIKGSWINITKMRFPNLPYSKDDQDSITGFLKFIQKCIQKQTALHMNYEFRNFILLSFPALSLSLYRILETSRWLSHEILQPFTTYD